MLTLSKQYKQALAAISRATHEKPIPSLQEATLKRRRTQSLGNIDSPKGKLAFANLTNYFLTSYFDLAVHAELLTGHSDERVQAAKDLLKSVEPADAKALQSWIHEHCLHINNIIAKLDHYTHQHAIYISKLDRYLNLLESLESDSDEESYIEP